MEKFKFYLKKYKFLLLGLIILIIAISCLTFFLTRPPRITIQNYNEISDASGSSKRTLEEFLYRFLDIHYSDLKDVNDAYIRDSSYSKIEDNDLISESFLLDIDSLMITYKVNYTWSDKATVTDGIIIDCPTLEEAKYKNTKCVGMYNNSEEMAIRAKFPITSALPIEVDEYSDNYSKHINYTITYTSNFDTLSITITITDLSGGNYDSALKKISSLGYNPADYTIEYKDESSENYWPRVTKY